MKTSIRIAGVSVWIWCLGAVVVAGAGVAVLNEKPSGSAVERTDELARARKVRSEARAQTEAAARKYFAAILKVREAVDGDLGKTEIPNDLPWGDQLEMEKQVAKKKEKMDKIHAERREAEAELEKAEEVCPVGYLRALRNCWGESIERKVRHTGEKTIENMTFEEAVELGKNLSKSL